MPERKTAKVDSRLAAYTGARAVITGGLGLIGSAIARRLVALGGEVLLIDSMVPEYGGNLANIAEISDRVTINIADLRGGYALPHLLAGRDFLFNLAAQTSHLDSMSAPEDDLAINCTAQLQLLEACRDAADLRPARISPGRRTSTVAARRRQRGEQDGRRGVSPALSRRLWHQD